MRPRSTAPDPYTSWKKLLSTAANGSTPLPNRNAAGHVRRSERMERSRRNASANPTLSSPGGGGTASVAPRAGSRIQRAIRTRRNVGRARITNAVRQPKTVESAPAIGLPKAPSTNACRWMPMTRGSTGGG